MRRKNLHHKFREAGESQGWWLEEGPLIAAVSGGGDSMALLVLLHRFWRGKVIVAHVEHGIRGSQSLEDARFVQAMAQELGYPLVSVSVDVPSKQRRGEGLEEAARRLRYEALEGIWRDSGASVVLLAHQADDQAETVLFHLCRGTGVRGLVGIPSRRPPFARPLMAFSGAELREFLAQEGFSWVEDGTNRDRRHSRNRIRHEILPLMRSTLNGRVDEHLSALAQEASELVAHLEEESLALLSGLRRAFPGSLRSWIWDKARGLSPFMLREILRFEAASLGWPSLDRRRTEELAGLVARGGRWTFQWKGDLQVLCGQRWIGWVDGRPQGLDARELSPGEGICRGPFWTLFWKAQKNLGFDLRLSSLEAEEAPKKTRDKIPWWLLGGWPVIVRGSTMVWCPFFDGSAELLAEPSPGLTLRLLWSTGEGNGFNHELQTF